MISLILFPGLGAAFGNRPQFTRRAAGAGFAGLEGGF